MTPVFTKKIPVTVLVTQLRLRIFSEVTAGLTSVVNCYMNKNRGIFRIYPDALRLAGTKAPVEWRLPR
jgi:hypothetical protein